MENKDIVEKINAVLDVIRPYLRRDGGDIEFIKYERGTVYVTMLGACIDCAGLDTTLNEGIASALMDEIPEVIEVINIPNEME